MPKQCVRFTCQLPEKHYHENVPTICNSKMHYQTKPSLDRLNDTERNSAVSLKIVTEKVCSPKLTNLKKKKVRQEQNLRPYGTVTEYERMKEI